MFGGYTGRFKRSRKIERYDEVNNIWELIPFKLYKGFENGNVVPSSQPNKIIILGGKLNFGHSKNVWEYNIKEGTVLNKRPLKQDGILTKYSIIDKDQVLIIGESNKNSKASKNFNIYYEKYDTNRWESSVKSQVIINHNRLEKFKQYNFNQETIEVIHEEHTADLSLEQKNYANINVLFGTDEEPF